MRSRPQVSNVTVTPNIRLGDPIEASLTLTSESKTPVDAISLTLRGRQIFSNEGNSTVTSAREFVHEVATLMGKGELASGTRELRARFELPENVPATFKGKQVRVEYELKLRVEIPWWPDLEQSFPIHVDPRERPRPPRRPVTQTVEEVDASMFVELTLDDTIFAPGDVVSGAFALGHLRGRAVQEVELAIVTLEHVTQEYKNDGQEYGVSLDPGAVEEGTAQSFRFALPEGLPPSSDALSYAFQLKAKVRSGGELTHRAPIEVGLFDGPASGPADDAAEPSPIELGAERWRKIWAKVGAPLGLSVGHRDVRLTGRIDRVDVDVFLDPRTWSASLLADLRFGPWGVDLRVEPRSFVSARRILPQMADDAHTEAFGNSYKAQAREEAQLRAILSLPLLQALLAFEEVRMGDDHARAVTPKAGYEERFIEPFVARVEALARAISEVSEIIPPPAAMASMRPAWAAFATELGGELFPGSMAIRDGQISGARFAIETLFEAGPIRTRVALLVDPPLSPEVDKTPIEGLLAAAPPGTQAIYDEVAKGAIEVRVLPTAIEAMLKAPLADPAAERGRMEAMLALARRLRGEKGIGPYR
jgi:hypothetical protein